MDNGLIFLYYFLMTTKDGEGYVGRMLVTGLSVQDDEKRRKRFELRRDDEMLRH